MTPSVEYGESEPIVNNQTVTWADGLGVWHASVPMSGSRRKDAREARRAIRSELSARGVSLEYRLNVKRTHVTLHGTAQYVEV